MSNASDTMAARIIQQLARQPLGDDKDAALDSAAIGMFTADMAVRLQDKRDDGRHGWWNPNVCSVQTLAHMLQGFIQRGELLDAANLAMFLYCREGGAEAVRAVMNPPDPLNEALNSGDGSYRP